MTGKRTAYSIGADGETGQLHAKGSKLDHFSYTKNGLNVTA